MDYGRKNRTPQISWKKNPLQLVRMVRNCNPCMPPVEDTEPPQEDRRLENWRHWMNDRERRQQRLTAALEREPLELALNAHDRIRTKNEEATLLQEAGRTEVSRQDKYRGNPAFWFPPDTLSSDSEVLIEAKMSRVRRNLPPLVDRVGLPDAILKEKMLIGATVDPANVNLRSKWESGDYLRIRSEELKKELQFLEPHKPEMNNLVVLGKKFGAEEKEPEPLRIPVITISRDVEPPGPKYLQNPDDRIALKIQNREFVLERGDHFEKLSHEKTLKLQKSKEDLDVWKYAYSVFETNHVYKILKKRPEKSLTWSLHFDSRANEFDEQIFFLENKGSRVTSIEWRNVSPKFNPKLSRLDDRCKSAFYFDKNQLKILPGQRCELRIWFRSEYPLIASETWSLKLQPRVYPGKIYLRLWGIARGEDRKLRETAKGQEIRELVRRRVRDSAIRSVVDEIISNATQKQLADDVPYESLFLEADTFRARNPMYHYHSYLVDEFRALWLEASGDSCWNLSLAQLRLALLKLDNPETRRDRLVRFQELCLESLNPSRCYERPSCSGRKLAGWLVAAHLDRFEEENQLALGPSSCPSEAELETCETELSLQYRNPPRIYNEIFYVRIHCLLCETFEHVISALDSIDYFNKQDT